jgi:hypothetical protein
MSFNQEKNIIYVLSSDYNPISNFVSAYVTIINGTTNKVIGDFPIINMEGSEAIDVNPQTNMIYSQ